MARIESQDFIIRTLSIVGDIKVSCDEETTHLDPIAAQPGPHEGFSIKVSHWRCRPCESFGGELLGREGGKVESRTGSTIVGGG